MKMKNNICNIKKAEIREIQPNETSNTDSKEPPDGIK